MNNPNLPKAQSKKRPLAGHASIQDSEARDESTDGAFVSASLAEALSRGARLGFRLQKHERDALKAIREVADRYGVAVEVVRRGRGPIKAVLGTGHVRKIVGVPIGSTDPHVAATVTRKQAIMACREIVRWRSA